MKDRGFGRRKRRRELRARFDREFETMTRSDAEALGRLAADTLICSIAHLFSRVAGR